MRIPPSTLFDTRWFIGTQWCMPESIFFLLLFERKRNDETSFFQSDVYIYRFSIDTQVFSSMKISQLCNARMIYGLNYRWTETTRGCLGRPIVRTQRAVTLIEKFNSLFYLPYAAAAVSYIITEKLHLAHLAWDASKEDVRVKTSFAPTWFIIYAVHVIFSVSQ